MKYAIRHQQSGTKYTSNSILALFAKFGHSEGYWFSARFCFAIFTK